MPRPAKYKTTTGEIVVGTTTVINMLWDFRKSHALMDWSAKNAVNYEDGQHRPIYHTWARNKAGRIGTLSHELIMKWLVDEKIPEETSTIHLADDEEFVQARTNLAHFISWFADNEFKPIDMEVPLVSDINRYGGTYDIRTEWDVWDIKTGFIDEYSNVLQLGAYANLLYEKKQWLPIEGKILSIKDGKVKVYSYPMDLLQKHFSDFLSLLRVFYNKKQFTKEANHGRVSTSNK